MIELAPQVTLVKHPIAQHLLTEARDIHTGPARFRAIFQELSYFLAIAATTELKMCERNIFTPTGEHTTQPILDEMSRQYALVPVLRAGCGLLDGFSRLLPKARIWHLGMRRNEETLQPEQYTEPPPKNASAHTCFILDPMLATGGTASRAIEVLSDAWVKKIIFVGVLGSTKGVELIEERHPEVDIYLVAIDDELNDQGYILPGLGDAGDRLYPKGN